MTRSTPVKAWTGPKLLETPRNSRSGVPDDDAGRGPPGDSARDWTLGALDTPTVLTGVHPLWARSTWAATTSGPHPHSGRCGPLAAEPLRPGLCKSVPAPP